MHVRQSEHRSATLRNRNSTPTATGKTALAAPVTWLRQSPPSHPLRLQPLWCHRGKHGPCYWLVRHICQRHSTLSCRAFATRTKASLFHSATDARALQVFGGSPMILPDDYRAPMTESTIKAVLD